MLIQKQTQINYVLKLKIFWWKVFTENNPPFDLLTFSNFIVSIRSSDVEKMIAIVMPTKIHSSAVHFDV